MDHSFTRLDLSDTKRSEDPKRRRDVQLLLADKTCNANVNKNKFLLYGFMPYFFGKTFHQNNVFYSRYQKINKSPD